MKTFVYLISLSFLSLLLFQCKKDNPEPIEQLPPVTQEGKNTSGCLLNGKAWTPKGNVDLTSNYPVDYDPNYAKGTINISTYRYPNPGNGEFQRLTLFSDSLTTPGVYPLTIPNHQEALFRDTKANCHYAQGGPQFRSGILTITKLDLKQGIISGTFEFTLAKPGCDTIKATNGRFDKKL